MHECSLPHPYLQLYPFVVPVDGLHLEVDAHRADEGWREGVVRVAEKKGSLSYAAVANDEDFKHVVKVLVRGLLLSICGICRRHLCKDQDLMLISSREVDLSNSM